MIARQPSSAPAVRQRAAWSRLWDILLSPGDDDEGKEKAPDGGETSGAQVGEADDAHNPAS